MVMCMMMRIDDVRRVEAEHQMKMNGIHLKTTRPEKILILYDRRDIISFYQMFKREV